MADTFKQLAFKFSIQDDVKAHLEEFYQAGILTVQDSLRAYANERANVIKKQLKKTKSKELEARLSELRGLIKYMEGIKS
jgi:hypothetical protein